MTEKEVPPVRTSVTLADYLTAVESVWSRVETEPYTLPAAAVLYGHYWMETGGRACFNWNLGNVKHVERDGFDYYCLDRVIEAVTPSVAKRLVASGEATLAPTTNIAIAPDKVAVAFRAPHPQTRFRSFASLADGMEEHLRFLQRRFAAAWDHVQAGDYEQVAFALKARGYYTGSAPAYVAGMRTGYERAVAFSATLDTTAVDLSTARGLQIALTRIGFDPGPPDGVVGPRTLEALRGFQRASGLRVDGVPGPITRNALANALAVAQPMRSS